MPSSPINTSSPEIPSSPGELNLEMPDEYSTLTHRQQQKITNIMTDFYNKYKFGPHPQTNEILYDTIKHNNTPSNAGTSDDFLAQFKQERKQLYLRPIAQNMFKYPFKDVASQVKSKIATKTVDFLDTNIDILITPNNLISIMRHMIRIDNNKDVTTKEYRESSEAPNIPDT